MKVEGSNECYINLAYINYTTETSETSDENDEDINKLKNMDE